MCIQPYFETAYLGEYVIVNTRQKVTQNASKSSRIGKESSNLVTLISGYLKK
jgi:hypothetical protein